jgi:hypothetical protein
MAGPSLKKQAKRMANAAFSANGHVPQFSNVTNEQFERYLNLVENDLSMSRQWMQQILDPRRNLELECGCPDINAQVDWPIYRALFDRDPIANRLVKCEPKESWQGQPSVHEDEDPENVTEFEEAWDNLGKNMIGGSGWYQDEKGSKVWDYLLRADILSRVGHFGIILLGLDDGKRLDEPVDGVNITTNKITYTRNEEGKIRSARITRGENQRLTPDCPYTEIEAERLRNELTKNTKLPLRKDEEFVINQWLKNAKERGKTGDGGSRGAPSPQIKATEGETDRSDTGLGVGLAPETDAGETGIDQSNPNSQYFGAMIGLSEMPPPTASKKERKLLYMRPFDESLVQVVRYEWNAANPRFGQPVMYRVTLNDPREVHAGIGLPLATVFVHWTRVVHLFDNRGASEVFGRPVMREVLNNLYGLRKIYLADPEAYWRAAFTILSFETHPQLGGDPDIDLQGTKDQLENLVNSSQRQLVSRGGTLKSIAPAVVDPTPHIAAQIEAICICIGVPVRVFKGSERGELASSQDDASWNDRLRSRQNYYLTPSVIVPFVDRLIMCGVLPEPDGYSIEWPDLDSLNDTDKAQILLQRTQAYAQYVGGGVEQVIPPRHYMTLFDQLSGDEADEIIDEAEKKQEEQQQENEDLAAEHGMIPTPPPGFEHPQPPPVIVAPGGKGPPGAGGGTPPPGAGIKPPKPVPGSLPPKKPPKAAPPAPMRQPLQKTAQPMARNALDPTTNEVTEYLSNLLGEK